MKGLFTKSKVMDFIDYVITNRDSHCDVWTKQLNNTCVTMLKQLSQVT